jgi:hypothetical protein
MYIVLLVTANELERASENRGVALTLSGTDGQIDTATIDEVNVIPIHQVFIHITQ